MLTLLPLQFLSLLAYTLLRLITSAVVLYWLVRHLRSFHALSTALRLPFFPFGTTAAVCLILTELIIVLSLTLGAATQVGALLLILMSIDLLITRPFFSTELLPPRHTYVLLLGIGLSLFITGPGAFAVDLPF